MFKDGKNQWITRGLFYEAADYDTKFALFTNGEEEIVKDGKTLIPLKLKYLEIEDPTEYEFACQYLGGWKHWKAITETVALKNMIEEWREELEIKIRAKHIRQMAAHAVGGSYQASKYFADRGWELRKAGAPSKEEKAGQKKRDSKLAKVVQGDFERLGLK